jgi:hypothetical protein
MSRTASLRRSGPWGFKSALDRGTITTWPTRRRPSRANQTRGGHEQRIESGCHDDIGIILLVLIGQGVARSAYKAIADTARLLDLLGNASALVVVVPRSALRTRSVSGTKIARWSRSIQPPHAVR